MIKRAYYIVVLLVFTIGGYSQILTVGEVEQEQSEWCWAGVSKCIVDYYGDTTEQCEIAEYTRNTATWHNFGNIDCCNNPNVGCNYWNYNYGYPGSIKYILIHFSGVNNYGINNTLSTSTIDTELANGRPFVIRWGWYSGGGHFVVGYGKSGNTIYYMNPWYGEGKKFADYNWVLDDGNHLWTHTNVLTTSPNSISDLTAKGNGMEIKPNPSDGNFVLQFENELKSNSILKIYSISGKKVYEQEVKQASLKVNLSPELSRGLYFIKIEGKNEVFMKKVVIY